MPEFPCVTHETALALREAGLDMPRLPHFVYTQRGFAYCDAAHDDLLFVFIRDGHILTELPRSTCLWAPTATELLQWGCEHGHHLLLDVSVVMGDDLVEPIPVTENVAVLAHGVLTWFGVSWMGDEEEQADSPHEAAAAVALRMIQIASDRQALSTEAGVVTERQEAP